MLMLGAAVFAASVEAGSPPSRQTPTIVSKDRQGVVEVGPCQLPPCVGGKACTPNARDYGYYEGTWRQWPTQHRYDQKFPQAIGATPIRRASESVVAAPAQAVPMNTAPQITAPQTQNAPVIDADTIVVPDEPAPVPLMGNFSAQDSVVPGNTVVPNSSAVPQNVTLPSAPAAPADPLLDYSSNSVPGISTAPGITSAPATVPAPAPVLDAPEAPALEAVPEAPALEAPEAPALDAEDDAESELTAPAPNTDSPVIESDSPAAPAVNDSATSLDDSLSVPMTQAPANTSAEHSIIISQLAPLPQPEDSYEAPQKPAILNPYNTAQVAQVSHTEPSADAAPEAVNPFQTAVIDTDVEEAPAVEVTEDVPAAAMEESSDVKTPVEDTAKGLGLEGYCPVTLLQTEEWVEGNPQWSVMHHGIAYNLSSAEQVQKFLANPDAFVPVMDGADPVLFQETGNTVKGTADNCVVFEGKLYMFSSEETLNRFFANVEKYR